MKKKEETPTHNRDLPSNKAYYEYIENMRKINNDEPVSLQFTRFDKSEKIDENAGETPVD